MKLKLESKKNNDSNNAFEAMDKVTSKEKMKKLKSKDKIKKLDLKTKSEKLLINNNTSINIDNFDSNGEKVAKKKLVKKKTEKSILENNSKKEVSKEDYKSNDIKTIDSSSNYKSYDKNSNSQSDIVFLKQEKPINDNNMDNQLNANLISSRQEKSKIFNNLSQINISNNNSLLINNNNIKEKSNIFNLDISGLNPKNAYSNKINDSRVILEISPDRLKNSGNFMQGENSKLSAFNINEIEDRINITNLKDLNAFNEEHNHYFDLVLDNIQKKNRDKASKKNKNINKLLDSVNANLVNSKFYGGLDKSSIDERKQSDQSNINFNYQQSLITSHSEVYFDKKSPLKYSDLNNSKIDNDPNKILVSNKNNDKKYNNDLYEIAEEKKKRKRSSASKRKESCNLDKEIDINFDKNKNPKKSKKEEGLTINLNRSSDEEGILTYLRFK